MPICFKGVAETAERSSFSARRPVRYARWAPRTSRAARAASYVSCVAPIARRSCKHTSAQNSRVEPMLAATCACSPHTALHSCCLSRPRTGRMLFSPCAQRIAYYAIHAERGGRCPCSALQPSGRLRAPRIPGNCSRPHRGGAVALVSVPLASTWAIGLCARSTRAPLHKHSRSCHNLA